MALKIGGLSMQRINVATHSYQFVYLSPKIHKINIYNSSFYLILNSSGAQSLHGGS